MHRVVLGGAMGTSCLRRVLAPWCPQLPRAPHEQLLPPVSAYSTGRQAVTMLSSLKTQRSAACASGHVSAQFSRRAAKAAETTLRAQRLKREDHLPAVEPNAGPTGESLRALQSVKNIRDLSEACGNIAPGTSTFPLTPWTSILVVAGLTGFLNACLALCRPRVQVGEGKTGISRSLVCRVPSATEWQPFPLAFRSACPVAAVVEDVETLRDRLKVRHMVRTRFQLGCRC